MKVAVLGAGGKMGSTVVQAVLQEPDLELVALVDPKLSGIEYSHALGIAGTGLIVSGDLSELLRSGTEVAVDFTDAASAYQNLLFCAENGISAVVGTTGLSTSQLEELNEKFLASGVGCIVAANFAIGAILMMKFAEMAAPFFHSVEVVEMHHDTKVDAPSGTALTTAKRIGRAKVASGGAFEPDPTRKFVVEGARGASVDGVGIHSLRIRGAIAHQEVVMGTTGQSLTIRHDSYDRSSFMPGVIIAIRGIASVTGLNIGVDDLIEGMFNSMSTDRAR